jgi:hypothetical protein
MTAPVSTVAALDEQNRVAQANLAGRVSQVILAYWLLNVRSDDIVGSSRGWLDFSVAAILRGYEQSIDLASAYSLALQRMEIPGARPITLPRPSPPPEEQIRRSLSVTGPGKLALFLGRAPEAIPPRDPFDKGAVERFKRAKIATEQVKEDFRRKAGASASASAYKQVQDGGRNLVTEMVTQKVAVGYVTKDHPCGFCFMLASRGPVYGEDSFKHSDPRFTGEGTAKVHDGCGCQLRPLYSQDPRHWTDTARVADGLWREMLDENPGVGGSDARNKFSALARERGLADLTRF